MLVLPGGWRDVLASLSIGVIATLLATAPATVLVGREVRSPADVHWQPVTVTAIVAVVGWLACLGLRAAASRRYLAKVVATRQVTWSPVFAYTLVGWLLLVGAGGFAFGTYHVASTADAPVEPGSYRDNLVKYPLPLLFLGVVLVTVGCAGYAALKYRRRNEFPVLKEYGIAREVTPPGKLPKAEAFKVRTRFWIEGVIIDGLAFASGIVPRLLDGERPSDDELGMGLISVIGGPGIISFALLVAMFLLGWPARSSALDAVRQPSSLTAIGLTVVGFAVGEQNQLLGSILATAGVILASATCLNIMDRGSQPWLGFVYFAGTYLLGYFMGQSGDPALPEGISGWALALGGAVFAAREAREHWRKWATLEPLRE
ncbi:hypothetical protein NLX83_25475 [Allokutzneria sp. A3M-2-11 16]|uniref:hypothetical protein n=1 Tax=Allokutzneria sp. A3M-2-11 16 TaxID=2962043 RepID=UPI0020B8AFA7|nr:hypothetical protein [Allokutzneria sp. A3M-2-11 16]MCP3802628.1 hypothetical protein [Allokutzneria sp. A3M-2-11 16]